MFVPQSHMASPSQAFGNGFLQMEFISHDRAHHIAAHKLPESGRPANEPYEVGVSSAFLNAITQGIHSVVFIFLLPLFRDHVNDKPIHFGKVIQGDAMIRNLSFMPKADREGITAIIEAIWIYLLTMSLSFFSFPHQICFHFKTEENFVPLSLHRS